MALAPKLEIRQSQNLLMTPQLRQAINLLQMSNLELTELVEKELEINPLLEREDDSISDFETDEQNIDKYDNDKEDTFEIESDDYNDDYGSDKEGYETEDHSWEDYSKSKGSSEEDFDYFEKKLKDEKSLYQFLNEQISINFIDNKEKIIANHLCQHLDECGYFRGDLSKIASSLNIKKKPLQEVLNKLKTFEPSGIFAESLKECLTIQLKDLNRFDEIIAKVLDNLELLGQRKLKELQKICDIDEEDLNSVISDIKSLNPKPTLEYNTTNIQYIIPDVFVKTNKHGDYLVELNNMSLPRVLINKQYYSEINSKGDKPASRYLKTQMNSANFLLKALHQRATTILRASEEIVKTQKAFFEHGIEHLKPMLLRDIAEKIEMHESTISRVTTNKYMHTPRGLFELKYFFSNAATSIKGDDNTSTLSIKHKIKKMIDEEDAKNILSDDAIAGLISKSGFQIARRTVAKYRESMNIPSSADRKRSKRIT